jgi:hypothetical protein
LGICIVDVGTFVLNFSYLSGSVVKTDVDDLKSENTILKAFSSSSPKTVWKLKPFLIEKK